MNSNNNIGSHKLDSIEIIAMVDQIKKNGVFEISEKNNGILVLQYADRTKNENLKPPLWLMCIVIFSYFWGILVSFYNFRYASTGDLEGNT